jgi:hypothetical protein
MPANAQDQPDAVEASETVPHSPEWGGVPRAGGDQADATGGADVAAVEVDTADAPDEAVDADASEAQDEAVDAEGPQDSTDAEPSNDSDD